MQDSNDPQVVGITLRDGNWLPVPGPTSVVYAHMKTVVGDPAATRMVFARPIKESGGLLGLSYYHLSFWRSPATVSMQAGYAQTITYPSALRLELDVSRRILKIAPQETALRFYVQECERLLYQGVTKHVSALLGYPQDVSPWAVNPEVELTGKTWEDVLAFLKDE